MCPRTPWRPLVSVTSMGQWPTFGVWFGALSLATSGPLAGLGFAAALWCVAFGLAAGGGDGAETLVARPEDPEPALEGAAAALALSLDRLCEPPELLGLADPPWCVAEAPLFA